MHMSTNVSPPDHRSARTGLPLWLASPGIALGVGVLAVGTIAALHRGGLGRDGADAIVAGVVAVVSGSWLMLADRVKATPTTWRRYLAIAAIVWGIGQTVIGVELVVGVAGRIAIGDLISFLATPFYLAGFSRAVRGQAFVRPALRIVIDAVMVGASVALFVWRLTAEIGGFSRAVAAFATVIVLVDMVVAAFGVLAFIRRPTWSLATLAGGLIAFAVADLTMVLRDEAAAIPAFVAVLYSLSMPVLVTVARVIEPEPLDGQDVRRDTREASGAVAITAAAIVADAAHVAIGRGPTTWPPIVFVLVTISAFFVRHFIDHQQRRAMFALLRHQARSDPLTGVGNRFALDEIAEQIGNVPLDVVVVGVDGLPAFTDVHGAREGDALVVRVADALARVYPSASALVRLESAEFAIVQPAAGDDQLGAALTAVEVATVAALRTVEADTRLQVTGGAARREHAGTSLLDLVGRAQRARHLARTQPTRRVCVYDRTLLERDERERLIDQRLPLAIDRGDITIHLQPVVALASGRVVGVEALARWVDPVLGTVTPVEFIARAEATEQINRLGAAMLRQAVTAAVLLGLPERGVAVSVNVSVAQLRPSEGSTRFADEVLATLQDSGLAPGLLVLEVTESILVEEDDPAMDELRRVAALGVRIAVDDFGSGYWALSCFRWFSADILKIDRVLVEALARDARSRAVVGSIVELCKRTGMVAVAEGIEDESMGEVARELGVVNAQGWAYARAVPVGELIATIDRIEASALSAHTR